MLIFIAHLPQIRMQRDEDFPIGSGVLTKLPWPQFDELTQRAFTDWKDRYEQTEPVFFWHQAELDLPFVRPGREAGMEEIKTPMGGMHSLIPRLGYGIVTVFHDHLVDPVWAALALAAPGGVAAPPRSSMTFCVPAGDFHFEFGERRNGGVRIQGDADLELVFLAEGAATPLTDEVLSRAAGLVGVAQAGLEDDEVAPALRTLLASAHVSLTPIEQMLLAVTATENLLSPDEIRTNAETLSRRLAHLLGHDEAHGRLVEEAARNLYRHRSAVIHADVPVDDAHTGAAEAAAQLLAGSIEGVTRARAEGLQLEQLRQQLDAAPAAAPPGARWPQAGAPGRAGTFRLGPRAAWFAGTVSSEGALGSSDGTLISWSPLIGLQAADPFIVHPDLGLQMGPLSAAAIVSMEQKDIRRDFIAKVRLEGPVAALAVRSEEPVEMVDETHVRRLTRTRDLAVAGLRLTGFDAFIDPALLGWYVYHGATRHRRETVLRQSIIMAIQSAPPLTVEGAALEATSGAWSLLARYEREARHEGIDRMLDLYRRIHDRHFLDLATRASLGMIVLESMIGPFRAPTSPRRLEALVGAIDGVPLESAAWFAAEGRAFRNGVAHGTWRPGALEGPGWWTSDNASLGHIIAIATAATRELLELWVDADAPVRAHHGPQGLLARALARRVA